MSAVIIKNVQKVYDNGFCAIKNANLEILPGEFMVLVGPSGSAKSTLLRMVAGLEETTAGSISINGKDITNAPSKDRGIAMVFQNYALYPHMTCFDNMAFGLQLEKVPKAEIEKRVNHVAKLLEVETLLNRKPREMSGGQRQRVALGRALIREPKVFLFDEPLSNLDAKLRVSTRQRIKALHAYLRDSETPPSMIYVTHDQVEAMTLGDRICVLKEGEIQQVGSPLTLYNSPSNRFVAQFIGSPSMNVFQVTRAGDKFVREDLAIAVPESLKNRIKDGETVDIGIRPESITLNTEGCSFKCEVVDVELMGNGTYLHVKALELEDTICIHLPADHSHIPTMSEQVMFYINPTKILFFDSETGWRIEHE